MLFYDKNLELLKASDQELWQVLTDFETTKSYGNWQLTDTDKEFKVQQNGKIIFTFQPTGVDEASEWEKHATLSLTPVLIVFGLGFGNHLATWQQKYFLQFKSVIIVEPSLLVLRHFLQHYDCSQLLTRTDIHWAVGLHVDHVQDWCREYFLKDNRLNYFGPFSVLHTLSAHAYCGPAFAHFAETYQQTGKQLVQKLEAIDPDDAFRGWQNCLENFKKARPHFLVSQLQDLLKNQPVLIIAAGPSLTHHLQYLKRFHAKLFLIVADSVAALLIDQGIQPDIVCSLERDGSLAKVFANLDCTSMKNSLLLTLPLTHPEILKKSYAHVMFASRATAFGKLLWPDTSLLNYGDNVSSMGLRVAKILGATAVYFLGQDLAYDRQSAKSHALGVREESQNIEAERRKSTLFCSLTGNNNQPIESTIYWQMFGVRLAQMAQTLQLNCFNVIPENYGAKIEGFTHINLLEFWETVVPSFAELPKILPLLNGRPLTQTGGQEFWMGIYQQLDLTKQKLNEMSFNISKLVCDFVPESNAPEVVARFDNYFDQWQNQLDKIWQESETAQLVLYSVVKPAYINLYRSFLWPTISLTSLERIWHKIRVMQQLLLVLIGFSERLGDAILRIQNE